MKEKKHRGFSMTPFVNVVKEGVNSTDINYSLEVVNDGKQNDFPTYLYEIIQKSPIATACINRLTQFYYGNGLIPEVRDIVVNNQGDTLDDIHGRVSEDYAYYDRFGMELIPDRQGIFREVTQTPAEWIRYKSNEDIYDPVYEYVKVNPFINTFEEYWKNEQIKILKLFENQDASEIRSDIRENPNYRGHILFFNETKPGARIYSRPNFFASEKTILVDGKMWEFHDRNTSNNFFLGFIMSVVADPEAGYGEKDSNGNYYRTFREVFESEMQQMFAGTQNAGTGITFYLNDKDDPVPTLSPLPASRSDEMFTRLWTDIVNTLIANFGVPKVLLPLEISGKLGTSTEFRNGIKFLNETTKKKRNVLDRAYKKILDAMGIEYPDQPLIIPIQDDSDLPDIIFNALNAEQKAEYLQTNFNIAPSEETEEEVEEETDEENLVTIAENGRSNN